MIVFVHLPKTGGTTFKFILRNTFILRHCDTSKSKQKVFTNRDLKRAQRFFFGLKSLCGHNLIEPTKNLVPGDFELVTLLRDPVKRCISYYQEEYSNGRIQLPFKDWLLKEHTPNIMTRFIAGSTDPDKAFRLLRDQYTFCGLTERFEESLKLIQVLSAYKLYISYHSKRVAPKNEIKRQIQADQEAVGLIRAYNQADLYLYSLVANSLFPSYLQRYQQELAACSIDTMYRSNLSRLRHGVCKGYNNLVYANLSKLLKKLAD
jgi:hypothetical protein